MNIKLNQCKILLESWKPTGNEIVTTLKYYSHNCKHYGDIGAANKSPNKTEVTGDRC